MAGAARSFQRTLVLIEQWRERHIRHRNFLLLMSIIVGLVSGLAAVALKISVAFFEHRAHWLNTRLDSTVLTALFPLIGTGLSLMLLVRLFRNKLSRGVGFIIRNIYANRSRMPRRHILGHIITSAVTVAFGGSVGLEAPIVATGAAIGSNAAGGVHLSHKDTTLLLACGTASGIAAVFNSPIAGIIFVLEVFLLDFNIPSFIPLLVSTASATVLSQLLYPNKFAFQIIGNWETQAIPFYILLGITCGLVSVYVTHIVEKIEGFFFRRKLGWKTWLMAGIPLCLLTFLLPALYGEGYETIRHLLAGDTSRLTAHSILQVGAQKHWAVIAMCVLLIAFKAISAPLTVSAGGNGGIFAPSMIIGGLVGFLFSYVVNLTPWFHLRTPNFIIAAMAGVLAGVMHAPLTAIFLLAEITGGYALFIPLMIVTAVSYFMTRRFVHSSLYHKELIAQRILDAPADDDHF